MTRATLEEHLRVKMREYLQSRPEPTPAFRFRIGWSSSYSDLFDCAYKSTTGIGSIIENALASGRVLLSGRGGGAKSTIILRLIREAVENPKVVPLLIDLKSWKAEHYHYWKALRGEWIPRFAMLLEQFGHPAVELSQLEFVNPSAARLIFIDGLNEVSSGVAQEIITAADNFAQKTINGAVVMSDRVVRRELPDPQRWHFASVQPLASQEVRRVLEVAGRSATTWENADGDARTLLEIPFFLNQFLAQGHADVVTATKSSVIRSYFDSHVGLTQDEFSRVAQAAFELYRGDQSRTFPLSQFQELAGTESTNKMVAAGLLCGTDSESYLSHHLHHDFLASCHLVANRATWNRDSFDIVTFGASSFDAVAMAIEQITAPDRADLFVRRLYDWNAYSAAYSVAESMQTRSSISPQMLCIMLAVLAERRWDIIKATAERAEDALRLFPTGIHEPFTEAVDLEGIFGIVESKDYPQLDFLVWRNLFTKRRTDRATIQDVEQIKNDDSVIGWTVANVLKRCKVSPNQQAKLREISLSESATVRWRIVHALGSYPSAINVNYLVNVIDTDKDGWVRYGAIRSLVEMAALGSISVRERIFSTLRGRISRVSLDRKVQGELRRALFIRRERAPSDWPRLALDLMNCLFDASTSSQDRAVLEQQALDFKREYELYNDISRS